MQITRLIFRLLLGCTASFVLVLPAYAQDWPTTKFVIQNVDPTSYIPKVLSQLQGFSAEQQLVVAKYEKYLSEVAVYYQSMGFKAPDLPTTTFGEKAYIVYMYDYPDSETTALARYSLDRPYTLGLTSIDLRLDLSRAIVGGKAVDRVYEDLAHELFHNVQRGYQLSYSVDHGTWVLEGQAQALGMEAAKLLRGIEVYKASGAIPREDYWLGGRRYYVPLATETHDQNYRTASFWRYIGEHVAAAKSNGRAGIARIDPDYSYLAKIYKNHPFKGPQSAAGDLTWLDHALRKEVGLGLARLYPNFASTFAAYVPSRLTKLKLPPQQAEENWLEYVYGQCPVVPLGHGAPSGSVPAELRKNASRCFAADISGAGWFDISIQVHADTPLLLEALHIGLSGGTKVGPPNIVVSPTGGGYLGHWRFRIPADARQVFIISNMAGEPAKSVDHDVVLNLTASQWESSMTTPAPQAQPKPRSTHVDDNKKHGTIAPGDATRQNNQENLAAGLASRSNQTAIGTRAFFNRNVEPCTQPFAVLGCGPTTTIQLALTPGVLGDLFQTSGTGGVMGQFMSNMIAIADNDVMQTSERLVAAQREILSTEGAEVNIHFPAIEYGFTGSFDNAHIAVSGANGAAAFQALDAQHLHIGHVTIEEFTPFVLRGRFSADLTRTSKADYAQQEHRNISGSFVVAAPWEGDRDLKEYQSRVDPRGVVLQDLNEVMPILGVLGQTAGQRPGAPANSTPFSNGRAVAFPSCNCSCQPIESYDAVCRPICAVKAQQCAAKVTQQAALEEREREQAASNDLARDVDKMRADFEAFLQTMDPGLRDALLTTFDEQPTPEAKRFMLFTYGLPVDGYGKK